jgi:hypothetical protein
MPAGTGHAFDLGDIFGSPYEERIARAKPLLAPAVVKHCEAEVLRVRTSSKRTTEFYFPTPFTARHGFDPFGGTKQVVIAAAFSYNHPLFGPGESLAGCTYILDDKGLTFYRVNTDMRVNVVRNKQ